MNKTRCMHCDRTMLLDDEDTHVLRMCDTGDILAFCSRECRHVYECETEFDVERCEGEMIDDGFALMSGGE